MERSARPIAPHPPLLRHDLEESLERRAINPLTLSAFQRILLTTDGTVTEILEAFSGESIRVVKLHQDVSILERAVASLELPWGEPVLRRSILLQGHMSLVHFLYADSIIALDRLTEGVRDGLLTSKKGIGMLILEQRIETFKEILDCGIEPAAGLAEYFQVEPEASIIHRTYRMLSGGRPIMVITEKFPSSYFQDWDPSATSSAAPARRSATARADTARDASADIVLALDHFLRGELARTPEAPPIAADTDLFAAGFLDTRNIFELIRFLAERFGVQFDDAELVPESFRTLTAIAALVETHRSHTPRD
ncbi:MAG: chorismate pyruvate-lyase family protein [Cyanobacteriota bacterium]|nr:chorismate pyruvate-lyase family protein [Cyanobacteriota bacterium]